MAIFEVLHNRTTCSLPAKTVFFGNLCFLGVNCIIVWFVFKFVLFFSYIDYILELYNSIERKEKIRPMSMKNNHITYEKNILDWRLNTRFTSKPDFPEIFCIGKQPLFCYKASSFSISDCVIPMQTSPWTWSLGVTFEARLFWYVAYRTRNL